jgi:arylsulfatase A-like enzyme
VVIYTSDNGFLCGSHGYGSKVLPYEEASRVPLIMFDPRHENSGKGLRCDALTGNVDFAPTMLELAGLPAPANMDGRSLLSLYADPGATIHEWLPLINVWGPQAVHSLSVVTKDWKYIYWPCEEQGLEPTEELYHTAEDPLELTNLIDEQTRSSDRQRMRSVYADAVGHWQQEAVPYHNYRDFADLFDRN